MINTTIAHYRITAKLGQGGMGEVYRATDTKLDREVAIKVLPASFVRDRERLARFEREAKSLAALNHPNIGGIHGLESREDSQALVLELVEGIDLSEKLRKGPLEVDEGLNIGRQIAEALEAAHEKGIIHRDLKPANIKVTEEGNVKVLDFGLAKTTVKEASPVDLDSPTITDDHTLPGTLLGTAGYMSPEQAKGKPVDKRSDIWSFGIVLFECLTGTRLFHGETVTDSIGALLHKEPEWSALPANTPPSIQLLLRKCLKKDRKQRLHDIADARIELEEAINDPNSSFLQLNGTEVSSVSSGSFGRNHAAALVLIACLLTAGLTWIFKPSQTESAPRPRYAELHFPGEYELSHLLNTFALSPNGEDLIYNLSDVGSGLLYSRSLVKNQADVALTGTERAMSMFLSPNGEWIGFNTFKGNSLRKAPVNGGPFLQINDLKDIDPMQVWGGTWTEKGLIVLAVNHGGNGLVAIPDQGGDLLPLTKLASEDETHSWPQALPGGRYILYGSHSGEPNPKGRIQIVEISTGESQTLFSPVGEFTKARYSEKTGHLLFHRESGVFALSFDPKRLSIVGDPKLVVTGVWGSTNNRSAQFEVSSRGDLVYLPDPGREKERRGLYWLKDDQTRTPATSASGDWKQSKCNLSQDASRIALTLENDIWILDLESDQDPSRLTNEANLSSDPIWSPDDEWLYYLAIDENKQGLYRIKTDLSSDQPELIFQNEKEDLTLTEVSAITPDWKDYIVTVRTQANEDDIMRLRQVDGEFQLEPLLNSTFSEARGKVSPDGRWLAYSSNRNGSRKIFIRPYDRPGPARSVSSQAGLSAIWSEDGKHLYVESLDGIHQVEFQPENGLIVPPLSSQTQRRIAIPNGVHAKHIEISRKGDKTIVMARANQEAKGSSNYSPTAQTKTLKVVFDWATELNQKTAEVR